MTNEQFSAYLSDESHLYTIGYEELKTHVMNYPFSANLRVLLLKKSLLEKNKDTERNTAMAATYTTDRRQLSKLVKRLKNPIKVSENVVLGADFLELTELSSLDKVLAERTIPLDFVPAREPEKTFDAVAPVIGFPGISDSTAKFVGDLVTATPINDATKLARPIFTDTQSVNTLSAVSSEKEIQIITENKNDPEPEIKPVQEENVLKKDLSQHRAIFLIEENEQTPVEVIQMKLNAASKNSAPFVTAKPIELEIINAGKTVIKESPQSNTDTDAKLSFTTWLKQFRVNEPPAETEIPEKIQTIPSVSEKITETPIQIFAEQEHPEAVLQLKENLIPHTTKKVKFDSLSQLFESTDSIPDNLFVPNEKKNADALKTEASEQSEDKPLNSSASPLKTNMHDLAVKSIMHNDDILSETLADIHLKQGNFAKAAEMYERLMLQDPEKSVYFAAKIKGLTTMVNSK